ncbi:MAG: DUF547 domain-containing protein [Nitrospinae bacterium]|nr:DUF547 domain-containing protein [Nitrospinota bacterium]
MFRIFSLLFTLLLFLSGCATKVSPPGLIFSSENADFNGQASWEKVLKKYVNKEGKVAFKKLASDYSDLLFYLDHIAKYDPDKSQGREQKLAFYINSYNALAMYGVIFHKIPKDFNRFIDRARFFKFTEFNISGRQISLYDYENKIIRPAGDPRVHFALNCMVVDCPRLPDKPFIPEKIDSQLNDAAVEFLNDPKKVFVDPLEKEVTVSEILKFYEEDFVNPKQAGSVLEYINRFRKEKIPSSYKVRFFNYDWTVNGQ